MSDRNQTSETREGIDRLHFSGIDLSRRNVLGRFAGITVTLGGVVGTTTASEDGEDDENNRPMTEYSGGGSIENAEELVQAIAQDSFRSQITSQTFLGNLAQGEVFSDPLVGFTGEDSFGAISTGVAEEIPGSGFLSTGFLFTPSFDLFNPTDSVAFDTAFLQVELDVPEDTEELAFDYVFGTEEIPTFVGTSFQDYFVVELVPPEDADTPSTSQNIAFLPNGNPVTVDNVDAYLSNNPSNGESDDVKFNAVTQVISETFDVTEYQGQTVTLKIGVSDAGDRALDSAVFLNNLQLTAPTELAIQDARVVQTVADTIVTPQNGTTPVYEEDDPPIVADRNAAVVFGLTASGFEFDDFPSGTSFEITITRNPNSDGPSDSFNLSTSQAETLATGTDPVSVLEDADVPVFVPSADLNAIEVAITAMNESSDAGIIDELDDSVMLTVGPDEDIEVAAPRRLNVGFIQLRDPQEGENYGVFGQGTPRNFEQTVSEGADRLQELLPISQLNVYRADDPVDAVFATNDDGEQLDRLRQGDFISGDPPVWDARNAREALEPSSDSGEFVRGDSFEEFDLEVLVVPGADFRTDDEGNFERNDDYFSFHNGTGIRGYDADEDVATIAIGQNGNVPVQTSQLALGVGFIQHQAADYTVAHEAGHDLAAGNVYAGPGGNDPLAQRVPPGDRSDGLDSDNRDEDHARQEDTDLDRDRTAEDIPGVRSTLFRLTDGTFERASPLQQEVNPDFPNRLQSFMSYAATESLIQQENANANEPLIAATRVRTGADSRIYRENTENLTTIGSVSTSTAEQTVLSGVGILRDDGTFEFVTFNTRQGVPSSDESDAALSFEAVGPDGQVLAQQNVSSRLSIFADQSRPGADGSEQQIEAPQLDSGFTADDVAVFTVPFPDETTTLRIVNSEADVTTEVNPLTRTLRGLIGDIPDGGFIPDPEGSRTELYNRLDNARKQIDGGRFRAARNVFKSIRSTLRDILKDNYDTTGALEPTKQDVLDAVQDRVDRLDVLVEPSSGSGHGNKN